METFTLDPCRWRISRVFSTNPLVRRTDRVEAIALLFALTVSLIAIPVAAAVATTVYEAHHQMYAQQARTRHLVTEPTAISLVADGGRGDDVAAGDRMIFALRSQPAPAAGPDQIWVDDAGNRVPAPTPLSHAQFDAVSVAVAVVGAATVFPAVLVAATRRRLDSARAAQWDRELSCVLDDEGGRTNGTGPGRAT